jgi:hypothetical protein
MNILERSRYRVVGHNGPNRTMLPNFKKLGTMDQKFLNDTGDLLRTLGEDYDDLHVLKQDQIEEDGRLVTNCRLAVGDGGAPTPDSFKVREMRSIFLQKSNKTLALDEVDYRLPIDGSQAVLNHIEEWVGSDFFRSRINILFHNTDVPPHIDTNTSLYVRLLFMIEGEQEFFVKRRNQISSQKMFAGDVYFINQGWTHWIKNLSNSSRNRSSLLISCKWPSIEKYFQFDKNTSMFY